MVEIPYPRQPLGPKRNIADKLVDGLLMPDVADQLLAQGLPFMLVAPHIQDLNWWSRQKPNIAPPLNHKWNIKSFDATLIIEVDGTLICIDPGEKAPLPEQPPDLIVITHAHHDHTGALKKFIDVYPNTLVISTSQTRNLIFELNSQSRIEYEQADWVCIPFRDLYPVAGLKVRLLPAGHLLGAAMIELQMDEDAILVSGDMALREVGGVPGAEIPTAKYGLVVLEAVSSGPGSYPFADEKTNHLRLLNSIERAMDNGSQKLLLSAQSLGQAQEAYTAISRSQRAGGFPDLRVRQTPTAAKVSEFYRTEMKNTPLSIWKPPFESVSWEMILPGLTIIPAVPEDVSPDVTVLSASDVFTHGGWGEHITFGMGVACAEIATYHGSSSFVSDLAAWGRKVVYLEKSR